MNKRPKASRNKAKDTGTKPIPPTMARPRQQINNQQAFEFIDNMIALAPVSRQMHIQAQQAIQQIGGALKRLDAFMLGNKLDKEDDKKGEKS